MEEDLTRHAADRGPIRVLQSFAGLGRGGAEQVAMNWYRAIDRSRVQFDFVAEERELPYEHEDEIRRLGGRVFFVPRYGLRNLASYVARWRSLLAEHPEWAVIHAHHTTPAPIYLSVARSMKRICIAHSHNTDQQLSVKAVTRRILGRPLNLLADVRLACGVAAGRAMFGSGGFEVVPNSIDLDRFAFDATARAEVRAELQCGGDELIVGHVGRFVEAKNHVKVIDIFESLLSRAGSARLLLVGDGPLRAAVEEDVAARGISSRVEFLGSRCDVDRLMSAMDVFLLPSLYEGLPVTLVEAQANGLPSVISDTITTEAHLTTAVRSVELSARVGEWRDEVLCALVSSEDRRTHARALRESDYDISRGAERITVLYETLVRSGA